MTQSVDNPNQSLVGKIVCGHPSRGANFYLIVNATPHTVLLKKIGAVQTMASPEVLGQRGTEVPASFDEAFVKNYDPKAVIRARIQPEALNGKPVFTYSSMVFTLWDGKPVPFDAMD